MTEGGKEKYQETMDKCPAMTVCLVNLGCHKNQVDAEIILSVLDDAGYTPVADPQSAEVIIVNTCGFLNAAREESAEMLAEMAQYRKKGCLQRLVVAGCMADRDRDWLCQRVEGIDCFVSSFQLQRIAELIQLGAPDQKPLNSKQFQWPDASRWVITPRSYGFVKIADGCDNRCAYCRIPFLRGPFRSKSPDDILDETAELIETGRREIVVLSQDSTSYGKDRPEFGDFVSLLERILRLDGLRWLRLMYLYPSRVDDRLLNLMLENNSICRYLDIPLQHVDASVLKRMHRDIPGFASKRDSFSVEHYIMGIRNRVPDITIRTTLMTGFPGEDDKAFESMLRFIESGAIDHLGVFAWSPEPDTPASSWASEAVDRGVAEDRAAALMMAQAEISESRNQRFLNQEVTVVIDGEDPDYPERVVGRMASQAPEVDGVVRLSGHFHSGTWVTARVTDVDLYDYEGMVTGQVG